MQLLASLSVGYIPCSTQMGAVETQARGRVSSTSGLTDVCSTQTRWCGPRPPARSCARFTCPRWNNGRRACGVRGRMEPAEMGAIGYMAVYVKGVSGVRLFWGLVWDLPLTCVLWLFFQSESVAECDWLGNVETIKNSEDYLKRRKDSPNDSAERYASLLMAPGALYHHWGVLGASLGRLVITNP
nr:hypothetical protein L203_06464 [Cryptococcus depauperatus CBS 7841]